MVSSLESQYVSRSSSIWLTVYSIGWKHAPADASSSIRMISTRLPNRGVCPQPPADCLIEHRFVNIDQLVGGDLEQLRHEMYTQFFVLTISYAASLLPRLSKCQAFQCNLHTLIAFGTGGGSSRIPRVDNLASIAAPGSWHRPPMSCSQCPILQHAPSTNATFWAFVAANNFDAKMDFRDPILWFAYGRFRCAIRQYVSGHWSTRPHSLRTVRTVLCHLSSTSRYATTAADSTVLQHGALDHYVHWSFARPYCSFPPRARVSCAGSRATADVYGPSPRLPTFG